MASDVYGNSHKRSDRPQDHNTPPEAVAFVRSVLGSVAVDPCSNFTSIVKARMNIMLPAYRRKTGRGRLTERGTAQAPWGRYHIYSGTLDPFDPEYGDTPGQEDSPEWRVTFGDGLLLPWHELARLVGGDTFYVNPPWKTQGAWMEKCLAEREAGMTGILLGPLRTHRRYWTWQFDAIAYPKPIEFGGFEHGYPAACSYQMYGDGDAVERFLAQAEARNWYAELTRSHSNRRSKRQMAKNSHDLHWKIMRPLIVGLMTADNPEGLLELIRLGQSRMKGDGDDMTVRFGDILLFAEAVASDELKVVADVGKQLGEDLSTMPIAQDDASSERRPKPKVAAAEKPKAAKKAGKKRGKKAPERPPAAEKPKAGKKAGKKRSAKDTAVPKDKVNGTEVHYTLAQAEDAIQAVFAEELANHEPFKAAHVIERLNANRPIVSRALRSLTDKGVLERSGEKSGTQYVRATA